MVACISPSGTLGREDLGSLAKTRLPPGALLPSEPQAAVAASAGSSSSLKEAFPWKSHCPPEPFPPATAAGSHNAAGHGKEGWQSPRGVPR